MQNITVSEKLTVKLLPHQQLCFSWMYERERDNKKDGDPRGGIVADDMGLGKTVQMIALTLTSLPSESDLKQSQSEPLPLNPNGESYMDRIRSATTLVVCPLALVNQWHQEIQRHTFPNSLRVHIHHGHSQLKDLSKATEFDVIITTYQTVVSSVLLKAIHWFRIVLDEAHVIKNHNTAMAKAVFGLESQTRWLMSATRLQNELREMYSAFRFLRYFPFCLEREWVELFENRMLDSQGIKRLHPVLKGIMIRRTKLDKDENGDPLVVLPPKHSTIHRLKFRKGDEILYTQAHELFQALIDKDPAKKLKLLGMLRLRQACNCMLDEVFLEREFTFLNHDMENTSPVFSTIELSSLSILK